MRPFDLQILNTDQMAPEMKSALFNGLGRLKYKVICRWTENVPNAPKNVLMRKWFPQQDILGHPNVKLFITHGGLASIMEAIYNGVPVIAIPAFGDQPNNAARAQRKGYGEQLSWLDLTQDKIVATVNKVMENPSYVEKAKEIGTILRDNPVKPLDKAVYHIEYLMRHPRAEHLKSPVKRLYWFQLYLLDVFAFLLLIVILIFYLIGKFLSLLRRKIFGYWLDLILAALLAYLSFQLLR